jgi:hypothetical protein
MLEGEEQVRLPFQADPATPFNTLAQGRVLPSERLTVRLEEPSGRVLLTYPTSYRD